MSRLSGKTAIVTGAGAGMGRSVAIRYAREGARVVIAERNPGAGAATLAMIQQFGGEAIFMPVNVAVEQEVKDLVAATESKFGRVDVLYNNVARMHPSDARVHELSSDVWKELVDTNLNSAFYCAKYVLTSMLATGGGSLVFVGSPTALIACAPTDAAYSSTKSGVHALARVVAAAYGKDNIRANIIIPGTMDTPMISNIVSNPAARSSLEQAAILGRLGQPGDVDGLAVFLASDESAYCTGAYFTVDGGLTVI